ncbi:hypothetical protein ACOMHN_055178 [Nucella lapillus]
MEITVAILIGLFQVSIVTGQSQKDCNLFKIFDGNREVTNVNFTVHLTSSCKNGRSSFPDGLADGSSVGRPRNFGVSVYRYNYSKNIEASGGIFTWNAPLEEISRENLKGFYLKQTIVNSGKVICRLIDLQKVDLKPSNNFRFSYQMCPFVNQDTYLVYLTSLPPPSDEQYELGLREEAVFSIAAHRNFSKTPVVYTDNWVTWISVKPYSSRGIIEARFGYPTESSGASFTSFHVQLVDKTNANVPPDRDVVVNRTGSEAVGVYNFTNVASGVYKVQVQPIDLYLNHLQKCQCWKIVDNRNNCGTCSISRTQYFNFTRDEITSSSTSGPTQTAPGVTYTTTPRQNRGSSDTIVIVTAVVFPLVALFVIVLVLSYIYKKGKFSKHHKHWMHSYGGKNRNQNNNETDKPDQMSNNFISIIDITSEKGAGKRAQISRKKLVLLASDDHEYFTQAVERLAQFLQVHCMCDVTFAPQQMPQLRHTGNSYCWLSGQIDSADFVVIVTTKAALQLYRAFRDGKGYTKAALGPEGDLFTPGIQHICGKIANSEDVRHVLTVYFDHTGPDCRLPISALPSFRYHLPHHLTTFLHHIHSLHNKMDLSQVNLPLKGNLEELAGGIEWLEAVQQAKMYEHNNPSWFEEKFGEATELYPLTQPKPDYTKQNSDDSGYTEGRNSKELQHRLSSVSNSAGGMIDEADNGGGLDNISFSKNDFYAPSIYTTNTVYTVPYPGDDRPSEIDERSMTEEFHRLNQQYEQKQQEDQTAPCAGEYNPAFSGCAEDPHMYHSLRSGQTESAEYPHMYELLHPGQTGKEFVSFLPDDEDHDCISVSSAQSV